MSLEDNNEVKKVGYQETRSNHFAYCEIFKGHSPKSTYDGD